MCISVIPSVDLFFFTCVHANLSLCKNIRLFFHLQTLREILRSQTAMCVTASSCGNTFLLYLALNGNTAHLQPHIDALKWPSARKNCKILYLLVQIYAKSLDDFHNFQKLIEQRSNVRIQKSLHTRGCV